jgi:hypothetical protein
LVRLPDALELLFLMAICPRCLKKAPSFYFASDHLHYAAVGRVTSHRFIEKVLDMTKIIAPPHPRSVADTVTYVVVAGIFVLAIFAFVFLQ